MFSDITLKGNIPQSIGLGSSAAIGVATAVAVKHFFIRRYGGFTGDIYGFTIEVTELILLNIILFGLVQ